MNIQDNFDVDEEYWIFCEMPKGKKIVEPPSCIWFMIGNI